MTEFIEAIRPIPETDVVPDADGSPGSISLEGTTQRATGGKLRGEIPDASCQMPDARCQMPDAGCQLHGNWGLGTGNSELGTLAGSGRRGQGSGAV